jgi:type I restriction enzyme M protein
MTEQNQKQLGNTLWAIADQLRGAMDADDFRDYMLSFLFLRYLSDNYETAAKKELGSDSPQVEKKDDTTARPVPLALWYANNPADVTAFEKQMRRKVHYVVQPQHLWSSIANMARTQSDELLNTLQAGFKYIETKSFESTFQGLFSEIDLGSSKLGKGYAERNAKLCVIIKKIADGLAEFSDKLDTLGDAYEYLIGQFAAGSGKKAGEFYTPQQISDILSAIVTLDSQEPKTGVKQRLENVMDFACGSGSLLLNVRKKTKDAGGTIGKIYGQEKNITTYNLARMNMLLHGVKDTEFEIFHGDTLTNDWDILRELNPAKKPSFDAIVANPPFSYRWEPTEAMGDDVRFKNHGLAPKSAADFAFLLHGFHFLKEEGVMAIILPHGVLFRGGAEERIRTKLLKDGHIDTVIGLPSNLFYSTGIPVCILVLKKCKKPDDVLFINAAEHFVKGKRQNQLTDAHIAKIIKTYQFREEEARYARRVGMAEIEKNDFNLNISRYISTAVGEAEIDLTEMNRELVEIEKAIEIAKQKHNSFLTELGLSPLP